MIYKEKKLEKYKRIPLANNVHEIMLWKRGPERKKYLTNLTNMLFKATALVASMFEYESELNEWMNEYMKGH